MKVANGVPAALPRTPAAPASATSAVTAPAASSPISESVAARPALKADGFGGTASPATRATPDEVSHSGVGVTDPVSRAGGTYAEHFLKGIEPKVHVVAKGDTLTKIVKDNYPPDHMSVEYLQYVNGLPDANVIRVGQELILPDRYLYTVQPGDTLGRIAAFAGSTVADVAQANGIKDPNLIRVGQKLELEGPWDQVAAALQDHMASHSRPATVTVKAGDTLTKIAKEAFPEAAKDASLLQAMVENFAWVNELENPNLIRVGQELVVPGKSLYTVQPDDSLWKLSFAGYPIHEIVAKNGLNGPTDIHPGQVLKLDSPMFGC